MDRHQLEIRRLLRGLGLRLESQRQAGGHIKAVVSHGDVTRNIIFSVTPSDRRWRKNAESHLKKTFGL